YNFLLWNHDYLSVKLTVNWFVRDLKKTIANNSTSRKRHHNEVSQNKGSHIQPDDQQGRSYTPEGDPPGTGRGSYNPVCCDGTSVSGESDYARWLRTIENLRSTGSSRSTNFVNEKVLPLFDPRNKQLSASDWLRKVEMCAMMYGWDDIQKMYFAQLKLSGIARQWYDGLRTPPITWVEFKCTVSRQFAQDENFGKYFREADRYTSSMAASLQEYCYEKISRINRLGFDIPEEKLVQFIIFSIDDENIRNSLLGSTRTTIAELSSCLGNFDSKSLKEARITTEKRSFSQNGPRNRDKRMEKVICFNCGQRGHRKNNCPNNKENHNELNSNKTNSQLAHTFQNYDKSRNKCSYCYLAGHKESQCYKKKREEEGKKKA
ncbi:uncharacterized protein LOC135167166, partial [Diachasmimorpha longicaudata]|uniref:uncharacterized protein LOC135167166 n=1 Tax=Diachasmimorpha longicaudata TaxID=58733 RepID=UPI0030B87DA6